MLQYLSGISRVSLRKRTQRTKPIYKLFSVIGEDKIKRIKTYSANKLSKLTDVQIDTIKKHFIAIPRVQKSRTHMTEVSISPNNILPENKIHDHAYFCCDILIYIKYLFLKNLIVMELLRVHYAQYVN